MITSPTTVLDGLVEAWERSDRVFGLLAPEALLSQPIPLRQPFIFYLGHLPAFSWNHVGGWLRGAPPIDVRLDTLFARGIDPVGVDEYIPSRPEHWPPRDEVIAYRDRVRAALRELVPRLDAEGERERLVLGTLLEHELMHHETLLYMVQRLPLDQIRRPADVAPDVFDGAAPRGPVTIPSGPAVLGRPRDALAFGWDNEFPVHQVEVPAFVIDGTPVRQRELLAFLEDGGYARPELWVAESWAWRARRNVTHPPFWRQAGSGWVCRTLFDELPLERVLDWPVSVSWAEASAFARWKGGRLPTESELHRAAYGAPSGEPRAHPWGEAAPTARHGNVGFAHWAPTPVGSHPAGASAWGVHDVVGDGWEWTATPFAPLPGFEPMPNYAGYSADFFDGKHYVMLGASWATDARLLRRSFRNWFQPNYPHVFTKFRVVGRQAQE